MTNDEAIVILQDLANYTVDGYSFEEIREAVRLAIRALIDKKLMDNYIEDIRNNGIGDLS